MSETAVDFGKICRHLSRRDAVMRAIIKQVGPCTLQFNPDRYGLLVRSIVAQQISGKAAASISAKLLKAAGRRGIHPAALARLDDAALRGAGLSAAKARAIRDLTNKVVSGSVCLDTIHERADEEVIAHLVPVIGIGRWTAEMFLIFSLGRLDVLPVLDLGLRAGIRRHHALEDMPTKEQVVELTQSWRPYRTVGTWYIWRSFGPVPQSK
jgi:DNA-3-methyladenine glycosylase II